MMTPPGGVPGHVPQMTKVWDLPRVNPVFAIFHKMSELLFAAMRIESQTAVKLSRKE